MAVFFPDFVKVTIDGVDRTEFVVDYHRFDSLCELGQQFTFSLSFEYPATLEPYQPVVITERYAGDEDVVLRGFIITIEKDFINSNIVVNGHDKSILLSEFFVSEQVKSEGQSVDFFIQFFADLVGLDVEFQATSGPNAIVDEGTLLGLQFAADAVLSIERIAAYYTKFDSKIDKLITFRLGSSEPAIEINRALEGIRNIGTENTRNVVKVYGGYKFDTTGLISEQIFAQARTNIRGLLVDKTVVVTNSFLRRQTFAFIVADRLLNTVNSIDDRHDYQLPGLFPDLQVGQVVHINLPNSYYIDYEGDRTITSIDVVVGPDGAITTVSVGEKCPRISITFPIPPIYATTTQDGVAVSFDGGDNFKPSNLGLTVTEELDGKSIAANSYGQQMVVTAAGIFRRFSSQGTWLPIPTELPDPVNDSADPIPVTASGLTILNVVDEPTNRDVFHVLVTGFVQSGIFLPSGLARAWVYSTLDFGNIWSSTQLYVPASGIFVTETVSGIAGRVYDVLAHDLTAGVDNKAFAMVSERGTFITGFPGEEEELEPLEVYFAAGFPASPAGGSVGKYNGTTITAQLNTGTFKDALRVMEIFSIPKDREIAYAVTVTRDANIGFTAVEHFVNVWRTKDGGDTWTKIVDEVSWYSGNLSGPGGNDIADSTPIIHFDETSTASQFNAVVMSSTHNGSVPSVSFKAFFIRANSNAETITTSIKTLSTGAFPVGPGSTVGPAFGSANLNQRTAHSQYGAPVAFFGSHSLLDDSMANDLTFLLFNICRADLTGQSLSVRKYLDTMALDTSTIRDFTTHSADGQTALWSYGSFRLDDDDIVRLFRIFMANGTEIQAQDHSSSLDAWFPQGIPYSIGTVGATGIGTIGPIANPRPTEKISSTGAVSRKSFTLIDILTTLALGKVQSGLSTRVWVLGSDFKFSFWSNAYGTVTEFFDSEINSRQPESFAFKTFA